MPLTAADAAHLLRRTAFAPSAEEVQSFVGLTREAAVARVVPLLPPPAPPAPFDLARTDHWHTHTAAIRWWLERMRTTDQPVIERVALLWHDHFACGRDKVEQMDEMWFQHVAFRTTGLGDFAQLVQEVSTGGAMLRYLDNESNRAGAEQENFGRELMELFTCGVGHYTEADVVAVTRAWTGHNVVGWNGTKHDLSYRFYPERHDDGPKTLFGTTRNWDGPDTIEELCRGSRAVATSEHIATKFHLAFIGPDPRPETIVELGAAFRTADLDVLALLRAVLMHDDFWAPTNRRSLVKSPVDYVVDALRVTNTPASDGSGRWLMEPMGQILFQPPDVSGWGINDFWLSTATSWGRASFAQHLRWSLGDETFLAELDDRQLPADTAARLAFDAFGIFDPTERSVTEAAALITELRSRHAWSVRPNLFTFVATSPEFQVR